MAEKESLAIQIDPELEMQAEVTRAAIEERERMLHDPDAKRFSSVEELFEELDA